MKRLLFIFLLLFVGTTMFAQSSCVTYNRFQDLNTKTVEYVKSKFCIYAREGLFIIDDEIKLKVVDSEQYTDKVMFHVIDKDLVSSVIAVYKNGETVVFNKELDIYWRFF